MVEPKNIFILRNNDLGDVLVVTPLIIGLKKSFPNSRISVGVGKWARPLLENNPSIDEIISCNAPWHNKQNCRFPANSPKTFLEGILYVLFSKEAHYLFKKKFTHGIDVLGSRQGAWLLARAMIPIRLGVKGYAGGDNWCHHCTEFKLDRNVAESGLAFLRLMKANLNIEPRPIIRLYTHEIAKAESIWGDKPPNIRRIIIAPGGGFPEKCWGDQNYTRLTKLLLKTNCIQICIIGSDEDKKRVCISDSSRVLNFCGKLSLRESAAMVSKADFVLSNSSLPMHLAGAFKIPSLTLLGNWYESAELHQKQWGYEGGLILGKERHKGTHQILTVEDAFKAFQQFMKNA